MLKSKAVCVIGISVAVLLLFNAISRNLFKGNSFLQTEISQVMPASKHCKWPPSVLEDINSEERGYNITLCVRLDSRATSNMTPKLYPLEDLFQNAQSSIKVSFADLAVLPRRFWKKVKYPQVYHTYPQDVPIKQIVKDVKAGLPVSDMPQYNSHIHILNTSTKVCSRNTQHDLVIVVKSANLGWDARTAFRVFMEREKARCPRLNVGVVFSLGMPRKRGGRVFNRDGNIISLSGVSGDRMEKYDGKGDAVMQRINEEIENYDDIVLADFEDTYYNLTWKTVTNLRWLSAFCSKQHGHAFMIIDDDHRMNLCMVADFLGSVPTQKLRNSIIGFVPRHDIIHRSPSKKFFLTYREFPWDMLAPYPRGFCQFIGADIVDDMAIASAYTRHNYAPEDVFLGMTAFKLGIDLHTDQWMSYPLWYKKENTTRLPAMVAPSQYFDENPPSTS